MKIYKVLPSIDKTRQMKIWHKALRSQWSAVDLDWRVPQRITKPALKDQIALVLTPILMSEQAAMYSVASLIPVFGQRAQFEAQLYLTTWSVDEGRHTELFTRLYHRLDREPLSIRRFPASYLFQSAVASTEPVRWLTGLLVSEVLAKLMMTEFRQLDLDPLLSEIADRILVDEARHLGFNHIYMEDFFSDLFRDDLSDEGEGGRTSEALHVRLEAVLAMVPPMFEALETELAAMGVHSEPILAALGQECRRRLVKSIESGRRIARGAAKVSDPEEAVTVGRL